MMGKCILKLKKLGIVIGVVVIVVSVFVVVFFLVDIPKLMLR